MTLMCSMRLALSSTPLACTTISTPPRPHTSHEYQESHTNRYVSHPILSISHFSCHRRFCLPNAYTYYQTLLEPEADDKQCRTWVSRLAEFKRVRKTRRGRSRPVTLSRACALPTFLSYFPHLSTSSNSHTCRTHPIIALHLIHPAYTSSYSFATHSTYSTTHRPLFFFPHPSKVTRVLLF